MPGLFNSSIYTSNIQTTQTNTQQAQAYTPTSTLSSTGEGFIDKLNAFSKDLQALPYNVTYMQSFVAKLKRRKNKLN
jgi:hypothetical protein